MNICELLENSNSQSSEDAVEETTTEQSREEAVIEPTTLTMTTTEAYDSSEQVTDGKKFDDSQGLEADGNKEEKHESPPTATSNQVDTQESNNDGIDYDANSFEQENNSTESNDTSDDFDSNLDENLFFFIII